MYLEQEGMKCWMRFFRDNGTLPSFVGTGDSKSDGFASYLRSDLNTGTGLNWINYIRQLSGSSVASYLSAIETTLINIPINVSFILLTLGTNDLALGLPAEATWKANFRLIIERLHTQCPNAKIGINKPVYLQAAPPSTPVAETSTLNTWMDSVVAEYAYCFIGVDETDLENSDGYLTYFTDRAHQTAAGYDLVASLWQTAMGY